MMNRKIELIVILMMLFMLYLSFVHFGLPVDYGSGDTGNSMQSYYSYLAFNIPFMIGLICLSVLIFDLYYRFKNVKG